MKNAAVWKSNYFCGNEVSEYGKEHHRIDYATLAKSFDHVLNNSIMNFEIDYWEQVNGIIDNSEDIERLEEEQESTRDILSDYDAGVTELSVVDLEEMFDKLHDLDLDIEELEHEQDYRPEIFQYFIISEQGAEILKDYTTEVVFYNSVLDLYVWGIDHYGTAWDYVLTDIRIEKGDE